jgi:hypothetical protein
MMNAPLPWKSRLTHFGICRTPKGGSRPSHQSRRPYVRRLVRPDWPGQIPSHLARRQRWMRKWPRSSNSRHARQYDRGSFRSGPVRCSNSAVQAARCVMALQISRPVDPSLNPLVTGNYRLATPAIEAFWSGTHFVDAMNWLLRVIHGRSSGRLLRPRRRPAVGNSTLIMTRVPPCVDSRRASAARIHSGSRNPTMNAGVQCCSR